jgi:ribose transport system substrate-binding protein
MEDNMRRIIKYLALVLTVLILSSSFGCKTNTLSTQEKKVNIKVIVKKASASFWSVVKMGAEAAGKEFDVNIDFKGPLNENDIAGQIRMVDDAIIEKADALVIAACDYTRLVDVTEKAVAAKIPVIVIDSELKSDKIKSFIGTDNVDAGNKLGETLVEIAGNKCNIAVMSFIKGAASADQREEGLLKTISKYKGINILAKEYCNSDQSTAEILTKKIINENKNLDAIVCLNAYGTEGTAHAVREMNKEGKVKIIGFDSTPEEIGYMEKGVIQTLIIQNPFSMGYLGVKYALDAMNNKSVPKRVNTGSKIINKDNMYLPENQKLVFPFTDSTTPSATE